MEKRGKKQKKNKKVAKVEEMVLKEGEMLPWDAEDYFSKH